MFRNMKLFHSCLFILATMFVFCGTAKAQSGATVTMTSYTCTPDSCTINVEWNDPNNP